MKKNSLLLLLLIGVLLCSLSCSRRPETAEKSPESHEIHAQHSESETHEAGTIVLTEEQVKTAGVVTSRVSHELVKDRVAITGELEAVPQRTVRITSRLSGKVVSLMVQEGDSVQAGSPLAVLESVELAQADASFHQAETEFETAKKNYERVKAMASLGSYSKSALEEAKNNAASARAELEGARANVLMIQKQYERVKELQAAGIAARKDLEKAEADLIKARADVESARVKAESASSRLAREELMYRKGYLSSKEVTEAEQAYRDALSKYRSTKNMLTILGVSEENHGRAFTITSPLSGVVTALQITQGEAIVPTTPLMTVIDPRTLWLMADVYEKDLPKVKMGARAVFTVSAYPDRAFYGRVSYLSPSMDQKTRTVKARIQVPNDEKKLKVHMFAKGSITIDSRKKAIIIPKDAVQHQENAQIIYIRKEAPGTFLPRQVKTGEEYDGNIEILEGLSDGEDVVTKGSFTLKSEAKKATMEGDGCEH
ncbi:MAG: efflux RND transporter periplasmic adaptor subunit [Candidatus Eremiobacteraeota bacterium]|nr:efflux RND transporter periplasmic adaptor subunit [Candidatus Eremiobacteraeota bacterium]